MSETCDLFGQKMLEAIPNVTGLQESQAGPMRSGLLAGRMIVKSGPAHVPVSRFRSQDQDQNIGTNDTSGPLFTASSPSASLQSCLESRLRARLDVNGSPEYAWTWKQIDMPAGPPILGVSVLARRTSGSGFTGALTGWVTAAHSVLAGWATPQARDHFPPHMPEYIAEKKAQGHGMANLNDQVMLAGWATPRANKRGIPDSHGDNQTPLPAQTGMYGGLNPAHPRWLQGYPKAWDEAAPIETPSQLCRKRTKATGKDASEDTATR